MGDGMKPNVKVPGKASDSLGYKVKRFWTDVTVQGGEVHLDGRPVKTPGGAVVVLPNAQLAEAVAQEWRDAAETVDFNTMPLTRLAFAAQDRLEGADEAAVAEARKYAGTDLLCYPSDYPQALIEREAQVWGPVLDWAARDLGLEFVQHRSVMQATQSLQTLERIEALIAGMSAHERAGVLAAMPLFGSIILALALWAGELSAEDAFEASRSCVRCWQRRLL